MSPALSERKYDDRLKDYVEVKDRIRLFYEAHPNGRLVTDRVEMWQDDEVPRVVVKALAYRTPDDPQPGVGWSWMVLPGTTPYTRGSELENTETSAWGRAIGSLGIGIDGGIASAQEVRNKAGEPEPETTTHDGGLIGTVEAGKSPVDLNLRQTPDGPAWGFKLKNGRKSYQVLATGPLADAIGLALVGEEDLVGKRVVVWGRIDMIPWDKDGKSMPPYARVNLERLQTPTFTVPSADEPLPEAESVPMFEVVS